MNKKLDEDFKEVMNSGISINFPEEDTKKKTNLPKAVRIKKGNKNG